MMRWFIEYLMSDAPVGFESQLHRWTTWSGIKSGHGLPRLSVETWDASSAGAFAMKDDSADFDRAIAGLLTAIDR